MRTKHSPFAIERKDKLEKGSIWVIRPRRQPETQGRRRSGNRRMTEFCADGSGSAIRDLLRGIMRTCWVTRAPACGRRNPRGDIAGLDVVDGPHDQTVGSTDTGFARKRHPAPAFEAG